MSIHINQIIAWSGISIPENWQLCDGTNGTPDLRGSFIYGKINDSDTPISGSNIVHSHVGGISSDDGLHQHAFTAKSNNTSSTTTKGTSTFVIAAKNHSHSKSGTSSSVGSHSHATYLSEANGLPDYLYLYFIMKVA